MADSWISFLVLGIVCVASCLVWYGVGRLSQESKVPYAVYIVCYSVTSAIGATLFATPFGVELMEQVNTSANAYVLSVKDDLVFTMLIYGPLIVPGVVVILRSAWGGKSETPPHQIWLRWFSSPVDVIGFSLVAGVAVLYCAFSFYRIGLLGSIDDALRLEGDYQSLIALRYSVFSGLGQIGLGLIYVGLPSLSFVALQRAVTTNSKAWKFVCFGIVTATLGFQLMTIQKAIAMVFLLALSVALYTLGAIRSRGVVVWGGLTLLLLTFMQELAYADWSVIDSITLVAYRMAVGTVAYINIFPGAVEYLGIDVMLDVIGIGQSSHASQVVFDFLYPNVIGVQGHAPAPSHIAAYAEGGVWYSFVVLALIGLLIHGVGGLRGMDILSRRGALMFAIYMQSLVMVYYITQTSLRNVLISSYGVIWMFVVLLALPLLRLRRY